MREIHYCGAKGYRQLASEGDDHYGLSLERDIIVHRLDVGVSERTEEQFPTARTESIGAFDLAAAILALRHELLATMNAKVNGFSIFVLERGLI